MVIVSNNIDTNLLNKSKLQKELEKTDVGKKFIILFHHLCHNHSKSDLAFNYLRTKNFNVHQVDEGIYDHQFAISILKKLDDKERQKIYEITKKYLKNEYSDFGGLFFNQDALFLFDKSHNSFQKFHNANENVKDLFSLNFGDMLERDIKYNSPRVSTYFGYNLFVGAPFDDNTNIKIQLYHSMGESNFPKTGFYIYVGEEKTKYFLDCFYNGTYFEIKEVTKQEGLGWTKLFGIGVEELPEIDSENNYYNGLIKKFGKNISIDKDPFLESEGNNLIPLEKNDTILKNDNEPINMDGGSEYYYHKYIKYKNKYLELKKLN